MRGLVALKTFSRWPADEDVLTADPLARLRPPRVDEGVVTAPHRRRIAGTAVGRRLASADGLALLLGTELRFSDLADVAVDDVRPGGLVVAQTKNRAGRLVPLDPMLEALLARHVTERRSAGYEALFVTRPAGSSHRTRPGWYSPMRGASDGPPLARLNLLHQREHRSAVLLCKPG